MITSKTTARPGPRGLPWWIVLLAGIASVGLGILLLVSPMTVITNLFRIVGWLGIAGGAVAIVSILVNRAAWGWKLFGGAIGILAGLILVSRPQGIAYLLSTILIWLLGTIVILAGTFLMVQGIAFSSWARAILGFLTLAFGVLLIITVAVSSLLAPWLFAIIGIAGGALAIVLALRMRRAQGQAPPAQS